MGPSKDRWCRFGREVHCEAPLHCSSPPAESVLWEESLDCVSCAALQGHGLASEGSSGGRPAQLSVRRSLCIGAALDPSALIVGLVSDSLPTHIYGVGLVGWANKAVLLRFSRALCGK